MLFEVESTCNIESYCIFMGRGGRFFFFNSFFPITLFMTVSSVLICPKVVSAAYFSLYFSFNYDLSLSVCGLVCTDVGFTH